MKGWVIFRFFVRKIRNTDYNTSTTPPSASLKVAKNAKRRLESGLINPGEPESIIMIPVNLPPS